MLNIVLLSGGIDSAVVAAELIRRGSEVVGLAVDYGQRHRCELDYARAVAAALRVDLAIVHVPEFATLIPGSSQTGDIPVPEGHYTDESMRATVVPARNVVLLSLATAIAISRRAGAVAIGAHAGDRPIYPDCRPEFLAAMGEVMRLADEHAVDLIAPFSTVPKSDVVLAGIRNGAPLHLTWSCYKGGSLHCGRCGACVERREAFARAEAEDPTAYE